MYVSVLCEVVFCIWVYLCVCVVCGPVGMSLLEEQ